MKIELHNFRIIRIALIFSSLMLFVNSVYGQSVGDYRSNVNPTGNWTTLSSWQYYNGVVWVTPSGTSPQGYPGQFTGIGVVSIQSGDEITIGDVGISTLAMGILTINGSLVLNGDTSSGGINYYFNTPEINVTASSFIKFTNKVNLNLPTNSFLQVGSNGLNGDCSAQQSIYIGVMEYAVCRGNTADTGLTFADLMNGGGSLITTAISNSPICAGATINLNGGISNVGWTINSYSWSIIDPNNGTTVSSLKNPTISNSLNGTYTITLTVNAKYGSSISISNSKKVSVTVNALPTTLLVGTVTQPGCNTATGSVVLNGLPSTGLWNLFQNGNPTPTVTGGSGTTITISGLAVGTYTFTTSNGSCTSSSSGIVTISPLVTTTWSSGSWNNGSPTFSNLVVINGNYNTSSNGNLNACSVTVNSGYTLTITATNTVMIQNDLTINGFLEVLGQGSLVMINDSGLVINNGITTIHRFTTPFKLYDYTYWSTPVVSTNIATTFLGWRIDNAYVYLPAISDWSFVTTITPGIGCIIMVPAPTNAPRGKVSEVVFNGKVNNGVQMINGVVADCSYLLGNPYPCALNADEFLFQNAGVLNGTLYFWTHNTSIQPANSADASLGSGAFAYTSNDYATYNATGGVGAAPPDLNSSTTHAPSGSTGGANNRIPSGGIASGQGFFASSKLTPSANTILFNNSMRVGVGGISLDNSQFFKMSNLKTKTTETIEKDRIWLDLINNQGAFKQTLVGYITGATNEYDDRFDGESYDGNEFVDFYSVLQDKNLTIQGRSLPFDDSDLVPLGFRTTIDGDFTINIDQVDGLLTNQAVFIEDKLTNQIADLKSGGYTFSTGAGTFNDRFVLRYTTKTLATTSFDALAGKFIVFSKNKQIVINSFAEIIDRITVYDLSGRQIYQKNNVNSNEMTIGNLVSSHQALMIKTSLKNGETMINKISF